MKAKILIAVFIIVGLLTSCKLKDTNDTITDIGGLNATGGSVTFKGQIIDKISGLGINQAVVRIVVGGVDKGTTTDTLGNFDFTTTIDKSAEYPFITTKEGYFSDTLKTFALIGKTIDIPTVRLIREVVMIDPSGNAASIVLKSQSVNNIGIQGSGSQEAANLVFEVQDAKGRPVDADHSAILNFRIGSSPGAEEYLFPLTAKTNAYGQATVTVNSGKKAGVVQVIAETTVSGTLITSIPVAMAIHGGLPDADHFIVACEKLNYPFLGIVGQEIVFSAYVGDKYSNPVRQGTTVYFETTSGIIGGSAQTDINGVATVSLLTQPNPNHAVLGPGYFEVTAKTVNENNVTISTSTRRLLTGEVGTLTIVPNSFNIANGGSQQFSFTLTDILGHPMAPGTAISIATQGGPAKLSGATNFVMPDALFSGASATVFSFSVADGNIDEDKLASLTVIISITSTRGPASNSVNGTIR